MATSKGNTVFHLLKSPRFVWNNKSPCGHIVDKTENMDDSDQKKPPLSKFNHIALVATSLCLQSVVIILPSISRALNIPPGRQQWVIASYSLTFGCFPLLWGRIADLYSKRLIFIYGSLMVTLITVATPFIPNEIGFNVFRGLQGVGAAANVPTAMGIIGATFPTGDAKNTAYIAYGILAALGNICGNFLSGLVAEYVNWRWVFGICAIIGSIITISGFFFIPPDNPPSTPLSVSTGSDGKHNFWPASVDWLGAFLITIGLFAMQFSLAEATIVGWTTPWISGLLVVSLFIVVSFIWWQWRLERQPHHCPPLVKVSIFLNKRFSAAMALTFFFYASFNTYLVFLTYFFQDFQGLSPLETTVRFIPSGISGIIVACIVAKLLNRVPTFYILLTSNIAHTIACMLLALPISVTTSYFAYILPSLILATIGVDATWPCISLFTSQALPQQDQAIGGALLNVVNQFGRAVGLAIGTSIQSTVMAHATGVQDKEVGPIVLWELASLSGIRAVNWMNFGFGYASILVMIIAFRGSAVLGKVSSHVVARDATEEEAIKGLSRGQ